MEPQNKCKMQDPGYLMMMPPKVLRQQPNAKKNNSAYFVQN